LKLGINRNLNILWTLDKNEKSIYKFDNKSFVEKKDVINYVTKHYYLKNNNDNDSDRNPNNNNNNNSNTKISITYILKHQRNKYKIPENKFKKFYKFIKNKKLYISKKCLDKISPV
jgi:hypothetical protein